MQIIKIVNLLTALFSGDTDLPKVFVEETYMGGYNDLKAAILSGQFKFITRDR